MQMQPFSSFVDLKILSDNNLRLCLTVYAGNVEPCQLEKVSNLVSQVREFHRDGSMLALQDLQLGLLNRETRMIFSNEILIACLK